MSNEIATYSMILSKLSLGKSGTECPTKTQILAINSLIVIENASTYGANECVKIDDIRKKVETWNYYLTVSPTSMSFGAGGGSKSFTVSSYKRKVLDGVEQSGNTSVSLKTSSVSGTGFSISGTTVSASVNQTTSNRTGKITLTQNESNKTATINLSQSADSISSYGEWIITVSANPTSVPNSGGTSTITASAKRTVHWASGKVTEEIGNPALSTNLGSLSSNSSPSTLTLGENTSTSSRTATIKATHGGKSATCTVTQAGAEPTIEYVFTITPNTYDASYSNTAFIPRTVSTKNGSNIGYSLTSGGTDWVVVSTTGKITVEILENTTSSTRSTTLVFTQNESGKTQSIEITQSGQPAEYKFGFGSDLYSTDSVICDYQGGEFKNYYSIVSTKNGSNQSYYVSQRPTWVNGYSSGKVSIQENTSTASRYGDVILTQDESKKTITLKITQRGKPEEYLSIFNSDISTTAEYALVNFKSSQPWTCGLTDYDTVNPVIVGTTTGDASDTAQIPITYWKEYRRPRRVNYNIRQTAGQKLTASGSITFN